MCGSVYSVHASPAGKGKERCVGVLWISLLRWRIYRKDKKKRTSVFCKLCSKELRYRGTTTNMTVHLKYHHRSEYEKVKAKGDTAQSTVQRPEGQQSITDAFQHLEPLPCTLPRWKILTSSVCYYIAKDMMPFSTKTKRGFDTCCILSSLVISHLIESPSHSTTCLRCMSGKRRRSRRQWKVCNFLP